MNRMRHLSRQPPKWKCGICEKEYKLLGALSNHLWKKHRKRPYGEDFNKLHVAINRDPPLIMTKSGAESTNVSEQENK